ncbi:reverse transcriptase domain-containing protein [Sulfurovum sp.]|uniref:reverse transcriptase domain-containing protein n=1 Tax=Sulfurovum sp. TaxID=1969726 RepID=UPI00356A92D2
MTASESFRKRFTKKNLLETYEKRIQGNGAVGLDKVNNTSFHKYLSENINTINRKVNNNSYRFTTYKQKLISKGADSKPRQLSIPTFRDRLTLRCLCDLFFDVYSSEIKSEIPQVKIHSICQEINSGVFDGYVKIDIKRFYSSIDHVRLEAVLNKKIFKQEVRSLIRKAIKNGTTASPIKGTIYTNLDGIPQGLSISNILAEIFMLDFDLSLSAMSTIKYVRYVDDILILCKEEDAEIIGQSVIRMLGSKGLEAHPLVEDSKSEFGNLSDEFSFLGYLFSNYKTTVGFGSKHRFESSLVRLLTTYKYKLLSAKNSDEKIKSLRILEWRLNLRITGCIFDGTKRGWMFYYSQISDLTVLHKLDITVKKLLCRFDLEGKLQIKSLVKTYFEAQQRDVESSKYIINFDNLTKEEKIEILNKYLGAKYQLIHKTEDEINRLFEMRIGRVIKELEEDLQDLS